MIAAQKELNCDWKPGDILRCSSVCRDSQWNCKIIIYPIDYWRATSLITRAINTQRTSRSSFESPVKRKVILK